MARRPKAAGDMIAMSRIEHGEVVDGKNVVKTFEPGEVVDLDQKVIEGLSAIGAVVAFTAEMMSPEARMKAAEAKALADAEAKAKLQDEARAKWNADAEIQKQFPQVEAYLVSLDLA
ncbi:hypothetical protein ABH999_006596 [Bradyrhizobium yuanmingense]